MEKNEMRVDDYKRDLRGIPVEEWTKDELEGYRAFLVGLTLSPVLPGLVKEAARDEMLDVDKLISAKS